jgi:YD repeat-containing protein
VFDRDWRVRAKAALAALIRIVAGGEGIAWTILCVAVFFARPAHAQEGVWKFNIGSYNYGGNQFGVASEAEAEDRLLTYVEQNYSCIRPRIVWEEDWRQLDAAGLAFARVFRLVVGIVQNNVCTEILGSASNTISAYAKPQALQQCNPSPTALPVIPGAGVKLWREALYSGVGAHPVSLEVFYRSIVSQGGGPSAAWRHTYDSRIAPAALSDRWIASRPDGTYRTFRQVTGATPTFQSVDAGGTDTLERVPSTATGVPSGSYWKLVLAATDQAEFYDSVGRLLAVRERNGWTAQLTYNASGQVIQIANAFGRKLTLAYGSDGGLASVADPAGGLVRTAFNGTGMLEQITWQDGTYRRFLYESGAAPKLMTGVVDEANYRIRTVAYDSLGRVISSEVPGTSSRTTFQYTSDSAPDAAAYVTDDTAPASGQPSTRTYSFGVVGGMLLSSGVSAPGPLCGVTALQTAYDSNARKTKEISHDGSVLFYAYDGQGRETERAIFPSAYQSATTRPALSLATSVTSTKWYATWHLPLQVAEPGKLSTYTYDAKGNLTGQSWTATTDPTGALAFAATKTGSTYATGWGYNANSLNTSVVQRIDATETGRWTSTYNTLGDTTSIKDVTNSRTAKMTQYDARGNMLVGTTDVGVPISLGYSPRGFMIRKTVNAQAVAFTFNAVGNLSQVKTPDGQTIDYVLDANQRLTSVKLNGAVITPQMLAEAEYPDTPLKAQIVKARTWLAIAVESMMTEAHAQFVVVPGGRSSGQPEFDPRTDMLMSPMSPADKAVRKLAETIARACTCQPAGGYATPTFTDVTYMHVLYGGHLTPLFSDKSYFSPSEKVGQALVNEVLAKAAAIRDEGNLGGPKGTYRRYNIDMGRDVGMVRSSFSSAVPFVTTRWITLVVEESNCASKWNRNEVVTIYPDVKTVGAP